MPPLLFTPRWHIGDTLFRHERAYTTAIIPLHDDSEQRQALRLRPRERISFLVRTLEAQATGILDRLQYTGQAQQFAVPIWPHMSLLQSPVSPGSPATLLCDTSNRRFTPNGLALLYRDEVTAELVTTTAIAPGSLTVAALAAAWPRDTLVLPAVLARLGEDTELQRPINTGADWAVTFDLELIAKPGIARPASAQVFTVCPVNRDRDPDDRWVRSVERLDSPSYQFQDFAVGQQPIREGRLLLWVEGLVKAAALQTWYDGLKGAQTPFWMPTWQADFDVLSAVGSTLVVRDIGYAANLFPKPNRRHLALLSWAAADDPGAVGAITHRTVLGAVANGDGTETLSLDGAAGAPGMVSYLLYSRLAQDPLVVEWETPELAACLLQVRELAAEVAA